jgi:hypothetical protein
MSKGAIGQFRNGAQTIATKHATIRLKLELDASVRYEPGGDLVTVPEVLENWDRFNQPGCYRLLAEITVCSRSWYSLCRWH